MRRLLSALAFLAAGCAHRSEALPPASAQANAAVETLVRAEAERQRLVGVQYAVLHHGQLVAHGAFGALDADSGAPVTEDSQFLIASITKPMTAAATLRLAERGVIDLDAPIQTYVPAFPAHPDGAATLRLLLGHRGGIRGYTQGELGPALFTRHFDSANDALAVFSANAYASAPGAQESYSSYGYNLIAAALENATHKRYAQVLQDEVFAPLGIQDASVPVGPIGASFHAYADAPPRRAPVNDYSYNPGGGNVVANARAIARFGQAFLRPGFLSERCYALLTEGIENPDTPVDPERGWDTLAEARYGWLIGRDAMGRVFLHSTGASEAFQAGLTVFPELDIVVVALTNTWGVNARAGGFTVPLHLAIAAALSEPAQDRYASAVSRGAEPLAQP
jgi:CubicO group peptidase (beta-lactamase class C family)